MAGTVGETSRLVNAETATENARVSADRGRIDSARPFSNSAIFDQTAIPRGEKGAKLGVYRNMLVCESYLTLEQAIERAERAGIERQWVRRTKVKRWSKKSRYRFLKTLGQIGRLDNPLMITLTYRESVDPPRAKHELSMFTKWLKRKFVAGCAWRLELQTNKHQNIHFHLLAWTEIEQEDLPLAEWEMKAKWCQITGDGGEDRMRYGCHVQQSDGSIKAMNYLIGHTMKKSAQEATNHGRHWGLTNRKVLDLGKPIESMDLTVPQQAVLRRFGSNLINSRRKGKRYRRSRARTLCITLSRANQRRLLAWVRECY